MKTLKNILLYLWQLPQNLLGLLLVAVLRPEKSYSLDNGSIVYFSKRMPGGISLGKYSIVASYHFRESLEETFKRDTVRHEAIGHAMQSRYLGWLYLIVIGLPSIVWAALYGSVIKTSRTVYYRFYTERWADKLAGVNRND